METTEAGFLGVTSRQPAAYVTQPVTAVPGIVWFYTSRTADALVHIPSRMAGVWNAAFSGAQREADSPMSVVGVGRVAGEVGVRDATTTSSAPGSATSCGPCSPCSPGSTSCSSSSTSCRCCRSTAGTSPVPSGRARSAQWARLRGRPDPGFVDVAKALPLAYSVATVLIGVSALLIYADLVNPVKLGG